MKEVFNAYLTLSQTVNTCTRRFEDIEQMFGDFEHRDVLVNVHSRNLNIAVNKIVKAIEN